MANNVLPGEYNPNQPPMTGGKRGRKPIGQAPAPKDKPNPRFPTEPMPTAYLDMKKKIRQPGMQEGEKEQYQRIMKNRGVNMKQAKVIAMNRTAKGLTIKGLPGPKGLPGRMKGRPTGGPSAKVPMTAPVGAKPPAGKKRPARPTAV